MSNFTPTPFSILVGVDFRDAGAHALRQAARIAEVIPGSQLHVALVFEHELDAARRTQLISQLRPYVGEEIAALGGIAGMKPSIHLRAGDPALELAQLASDVGADLIVIGGHAEPVAPGAAHGTVARRLLFAAKCPVFVAP